MPIISKETWDKFTQEEKEKIREEYEGFTQCAVFHKDTECADKMSAYLQLFGKENLQPQPLTYEDVARELFKDSALEADFYKSEYAFDTYPLNCTSQKQAEKLLAINKLLNVAKFLNKDWKPDFEDKDEINKVWSLGIDEGIIRAYYVDKYGAIAEIVFFRTKALTEQAVQILGEDTVRLALDSNY